MTQILTKKSWAETYGVQTCTPAGLRDLIKLLWRTRTTVCVVGEAGVGKTHSIRQASQEYRIEQGIPEEDFGFIYVVLAHKDREHITGLYYFSKDGKTFHSMHNEEIVDEMKKPHGMYFIDEFNRPRDPSLLNAFFAMLSERGANGLYLNEGWTLATAINPASAEYMVAQVERDPAFRRRLCWVEMQFNRAEWMSWAVENEDRIHPEVLRYLTDNPARIYDQTLQDEGKVGPTPAGWEDVSEIILRNEGLRVPFKNEVLSAAIAGKVGLKDAIEFIDGYTRQSPGEKLPSAMEIVSGYTTAEGLRDLVRSKLKAEGIGAKTIEEFAAAGDEDSGDNKGWLFRIIESVIMTAINTPLKMIAEEAPVDVEGMEEEDIEGALFPLIAKNLAMFMADLPSELFSTFTSMWAEVSRASAHNSGRALRISTNFRHFDEFVEAANAVRSNVRKAQGNTTPKSRRRK